MQSIVLHVGKSICEFLSETFYEPQLCADIALSRRMSNARKRGQKSVFVTVGTTQFEKLTDHICSSAVLSVRQMHSFEKYHDNAYLSLKIIHFEFPQLQC